MCLSARPPRRTMPIAPSFRQSRQLQCHSLAQTGHVHLPTGSLPPVVRPSHRSAALGRWLHAGGDG